jgi:anti-sigma B factor antagonist
MSDNVKIRKIETQSDLLLITIRGSLDTVVAYHLQEQVEKLIKKGHYKFLVNLEELDYISSAGVGLFSAIILDLQRHHGKIIFINISEQVYEVLKLTHLIEIFTIAETQEEAIKQLEAVKIPE